MKKAIIILTLIVLAITVKAQDNLNSFFPNCGTWVSDSVIVTKWVAIDTLKKPVVTTKRDWIENQPEYQQASPWVNAVYYPCGNPDAIIKIQYRICAITGIRERREFIFGHHYIPIEKTDYEKTIDKFNKKQ